MENVTKLQQTGTQGFNNPLKKSVNRIIKRLFDILLSITFLIISLPVLILISVLIKITSKGPIIFIQERVTENKRLFKMYKFRTMIDGAEIKTGPVLAKPNDSRCTRIGNVLRRLSLDELPQLVNVLNGDMSIVGPRPEREFFIHTFENEIEGYSDRHKVKSGITGWAQINGFRGQTSIQSRVFHDIYYINNWNIIFDVEIIIKTLILLLKDFFSVKSI